MPAETAGPTQWLSRGHVGRATPQLVFRPLAWGDVENKPFGEQEPACVVMDGPATGQDPDPLAVLAIELELASLDGGAFGISPKRRISVQRTNIELPSDIRQARDQLVGRRIAQDASHGRIRAQDTPVMRDSPHSLEGILVDAAVVLFASTEAVDGRFEPVRHDIERVCQRADLIAGSNGDLSFEMPLRHSPGRRHQPNNRTSQKLSTTDRGSRDGCDDHQCQHDRVAHLRADRREEYVLRLKKDHRPRLRRHAADRGMPRSPVLRKPQREIRARAASFPECLVSKRQRPVQFEHAVGQLPGR